MYRRPSESKTYMQKKKLTGQVFLIYDFQTNFVQSDTKLDRIPDTLMPEAMFKINQ